MKIKNTWQMVVVNCSTAAILCLTAQQSLAETTIKSADILAIKQDKQQQKLQKPQAQIKQIKKQYIVQLTQPSVSRFVNSQTPIDNTMIDRAAKLQGKSAKNHRYQLRSQQQLAIQAMQDLIPELKVIKQFDTLVNAIAIQASEADVAKINTLPMVKSVVPVQQHFVKMDRSNEVIKSADAWQLLGGQNVAGKDVKIAIIDTGIRNDNPMFADTGMTAPDLSQNTFLAAHPDYCRANNGDASFCNNKVIIARWMDPANHDMEVYQNEHLSPLDFNGHGSHVAGIAAGAAINVEFGDEQQHLSGVAPASYLMIYKALFVDTSGYASGNDTMLLEALEYAVNDGADVINNSWGTGVGLPENSIFNEAITNAEASGVVVVNAAGNDLHSGAGTTINCPACIESGLAVANTTHGRFFGHKMQIDAQEFNSYQAKNASLANDTTYTLRSLNSWSPIDDTGCGDGYTDPMFNGGIIMVDYRHTCAFEEIANNIKIAGGDAVLVYQSGAFGMGTFEPLVPIHGDDIAIPVFGVSRDTGLKLFELAYTGKKSISIAADITQVIEPQFTDKQHPFSSTGPNTDGHILKPDISAPGTNILSAYSPDVFQATDLPLFGKGKSTVQNQTVFSLLTGTSMASPHVAGAAALIKQQHPQWSAKQIKAALTSTANTAVLNGAEQATPFGMGAGRLDLSQAITASLGFDSVSFADPACIGECAFTNEVTNLMSQAADYQVMVNFSDGVTTGTVNLDSINLAATGQQGHIKPFTLAIDTSRSPAGKWAFGELVFSKNGNKVQHLPIAVFANDTHDSGIITVSAGDGSSASAVGKTTASELAFTTTVRNINLAEDVTVKIPVPDNASLVTNSAVANVSNGETISLTHNATTNELIWQGKLTKGDMQLTPVAAWGNQTLASQAVTPIPCTEGCVYFNAVVAFNFKYGGQNFSELTISDNGFAIPGNQNIDQWDALFNQPLPSSVPLNNIIAPLWTEFDLADSQLPNDFGGGQLFSAVKQINGKNYLIVEWFEVEMFIVENFLDDNISSSNENAKHTFQLIIEENTDNIWFNYINISSLPVEASIGAENIDGRVGVSLYFDGQTSPLPQPLPAEGYTLKLSNTQAGIAKINYQFDLAGNQDFTVADNVELVEDSEKVIQVLANDRNFAHVTSKANLVANTTYSALRTLKVLRDGDFNKASLAIVTQPSHGTATVKDDGSILYKPSANYSGTDSLSYKVADQSGKFSIETPVNIMVTKVNDAPVLTVSEQITVDEDEEVTLTATATDADGDDLTYHWEQVKGPTVAVTQSTNKIVFTAPKVEEDSEIHFSVTAKDQQLTSAAKLVKVMVKNSKSSGGALWWLLTLLTVFVVIKRKS